MAKLVLKKGEEFTVETLLQQMEKKFKQKTNGVAFSSADIHDWANKRRIPQQYGGQYIRVAKLGPLKILILSKDPFADYNKLKVEIVYE